MTAVFADTFYWIALTSGSDAANTAVALGLEERFSNGNIITTEEVLSEFLTYFSSRGWLRDRASKTVLMLYDAPGIRIIPQSHDSFVTGLELYRARPDKGYSLTDCISMQTMRREGVTEVLTNDRHFAQEGFNVLFRR